MPQTQAEFISISHQRRGGRNSFQSRRRPDEPLRLLVIFSLMFFVFSCAKDQQGFKPSIDEQGNPTVDFRQSDPNPKTDCKCYMRVTSLENIPVGQSDWTIGSDGNYGENGVGYEQNGILNSWQVAVGAFQFLPLPSEYREVESGDFYIFSSGTIAPNANFTINTEVKCFLQNPDGSTDLATTTNHSFVWGDANTANFSTFQFADFGYSEFSCLDLHSGQIIIFP